MVQLPYEEGFDERQLIRKLKILIIHLDWLGLCDHKPQDVDYSFGLAWPL